MSNYNNRNYNNRHRRYDKVNQQRHRHDSRDRYDHYQNQPYYNYNKYDNYNNVNRQHQYYEHQYYQQQSHSNQENHYHSEQQRYRNQPTRYNQYESNQYESNQYNQYNQNEQGDEYEYEYDYNDYDDQQQKEYPSRDKTRNIRDMNNWCKYVNITHSIRESYKENKNKKINTLDLGCGKGGDLYKYRGNKKYINKYLGIDIDHEFIISARRKYSQMLQTNIKYKTASYETRKKFGLNNAYGQTANEFFDEPIFDAQFVCDDMNSQNLKNHQLIRNNKPFHLINIQFSLHYSFINKQSLMALLNTFKTATKTGSYFICSFVRDDAIIKRLEKQTENTDDHKNIIYKNQFQSIKMKKSNYKYIKNIYEKYDLFKFDPNTIYESKENNDNDNDNDDFCDKLIGIPYIYYQMDSVEGDDGNGCREYLVSFAVLCKLLWKHCKMRLIYKKTCGDVYIESSRKFPYKYGYTKGRGLDTVKWTTDEQQVIDTYSYALFQRV